MTTSVEAFLNPYLYSGYLWMPRRFSSCSGGRFSPPPAVVVRQDRGRRNHAARHVDVAGDLEERRKRLARGDGLLAHVGRDAPLHDPAICLGHHAGNLGDPVLGYPGDLLGTLEGVGCDRLGELLETVAPLLDEIVIVDVLLDHDAQHAHGQCGIRARTYGQEDLGLGAQPGHLGIDGDDLGAALHAVGHPVTVQSVGIGHDGIVAPQDDELGALPARIVVAVAELLRVIAHPKRTGGAGRGGDARDEAGAPGKAEHHVGATERPGQMRDPRGDVTTRPLPEAHRLRPEVLLVVEELGRDFVIGLVPADALPGVLAALARAAHGIEDAVGIVDGLDEVKASRAQAPVIEGILGVTLDLDELAVLVGVYEDAAPQMASRP